MQDFTIWLSKLRIQSNILLVLDFSEQARIIGVAYGVIKIISA
jgi:hypothetical protein